MFDSYSGCKKHNAVWNHDGGCPGCKEEYKNFLSNSKKSDWEMRFDEEFFYETEGHWGHWVDFYDEDDKFVSKSRAYMVPRALKDFIQKEITKAYNQGKEDKERELEVEATDMHEKMADKFTRLAEEAYDQGKQDNQCTHNEFV